MKKKCVEEEIASLFSKLMGELGLNNYVVKYYKKGDEGFQAEDSTLTVSVNYPYREVSLSVGKKAIEFYEKKNKYMLNVCLLHEIAHVIHWRYASLAENRHTSRKELDDEEEQLADTLALIFERLMK